MVDEQEDDACCEEEEDVLRERVRGSGEPPGVGHGRDHEEDEGPRDRVARVEPGPLGVEHVRHEETEKDLRVGYRHDLRRTRVGR